MKASPSLSSFNAGELSPLLEGRSDGNFANTYRNGARIMENFVPVVQGPAIRRGGTKFIAEVKNHSNRVWLIRFVFSASQAFVLEFGDRYIRFYTGRAQLLNGGAAYEVTSPYLLADLTNSNGTCAIKFKQSGDVIYLTCPNYKPRKLSRFSNTNWTLTEYEPKNGPFKSANIDTDFTVTGLTYAGTVSGAADNGSGAIRLTVNTTADLVDGDWVRVALVTGTTEANGRWKATKVDATHIDLQGSTFTNAYTSGGEVRTRSEAGNTIKLTASASLFESGHVGSLIQLEQSDSSDILPWEVAQPIAITDIRRSDGKNYEALTAGETGSDKPVHTVGAVFDGADDSSTAGTVEGVQWLYNDSGMGNVEITAYTSATEVTGIIRENLPYELTLNKSTHRWAMQAWSEVEGWPDGITIFRERLCFAKGYNTHLSVSGDFENMAAKEFGEILPDSAMTVPVLNDQTNTISWLHPVSSGLMAATEGGESIIRATSISEPLGPTNVEAEPQTSFGSRSVAPVTIGSRVVFVQRSGRKVYDSGYSLSSERYDGTDQSIRAEHITRSGVVDMAFQQDPYSLLWAVRADGKLVSFTTDPSQEVAAWHRHPIGGDGVVESVTTIPSPDNTRDDLWLVVKRAINGVTKRYIEVMLPEMDDEDELEDAFYIDSGLTYDGSEVSTISGLDHLEGETVKVLADGYVHPDREVMGGAISLQNPASKVQAGLGYRSVLAPMRIDAGSADGTAQGKTKRMNKINFRFYNTVGAKIGPSLDNLKEIPFRDPSMAMDKPIPLFSGDKLVKWHGGYDTNAYIHIVQDDPLPMTVVAIHPQITTYDAR